MLSCHGRLVCCHGHLIQSLTLITDRFHPKTHCTMINVSALFVGLKSQLLFDKRSMSVTPIKQIENVHIIVQAHILAELKLLEHVHSIPNNHTHFSVILPTGLWHPGNKFFLATLYTEEDGAGNYKETNA